MESIGNDTSFYDHSFVIDLCANSNACHNALFDFSDTAPIITVTALVIGFMLSGVMADHKEGAMLAML